MQTLEILQTLTFKIPQENGMGAYSNKFSGRNDISVNKEKVYKTTTDLFSYEKI